MHLYFVVADCNCFHLPDSHLTRCICGWDASIPWLNFCACIPKVFEVSCRDASDQFGCLDLVGNDFEIKLEKEHPFQHSGESLGCVDKFRLKAVGNVLFVSFLPERVVVD